MGTALKPLFVQRRDRTRAAQKRPSLRQRSGSFLPDLLRRDAVARRARARQEAASATLLGEECTKEQLLTLQRGYLIVRGSQGGLYYIAASFVAKLMPRFTVYCIHSEADDDESQDILAIKLLLESNEQRFLRLAHEQLFVNPAVEERVQRNVLAYLRLKAELARPGLSALGRLLTYQHYLDSDAKEKAL